ncbi:MAG: hypothetical protein ISR69_00250 [Gammaproteobacteria bacterium]|nr:hypothetical protein [Gammaproteobacteria bacterium]
MSDKLAKIQKLIEMQKEFMKKERESGVTMKEYFTPDEGTTLDGYRQEYRDLAMEVVDMAHEEKGSER